MRVGAPTEERLRAFWPQRSLAQTGVLASSALTVLVIAFLACTMAGLAVRAPNNAVRQTVQAGPAATVAETYQAALDPREAGEQDRTVRSVLSRLFHGAPVTVDRTAFASGVDLGDGRSALVLSDDAELRDRVTLRSGGWPAATDEIAVDATLAREAGLAPGSRLRLSADADTGTGGTPVVVSGVWSPTDASAPAWLGVTAGVDGTDGRAIGSAALLAQVTDSATAQWAIAPDPQRVTAADLPHLRAGFAGASDALTEADASSSPFSSLGEAASTTADMRRSIGALAAVLPAPLALLAVSAVAALVLLARLLARSRLLETRVLRARGASVGRLVRADAVEAALVATIATAIGAALSVVLVEAVAGASGTPIQEVVLATVVPALGVVVAAVSVAAVVTAFTARAADGALGPAEAGRARSAAPLSLGVLALAAAAVSLWRFLAFGAPDADGRVDPVGTIAPAAVLCAVAVLALVLLGPAAGVLERLAARRRRLSGVLPARQVSRGVGLVAAPAALIVLSVGAATFAAGYAGTWSGFLHDSSRLVTGADVRVDRSIAGSVRGPEDLPDTARLGGIPTVTSAVPALISDATLGQADVTVVAVHAPTLAQLFDTGSYMFDAFTAQEELGSGDPFPGAPLGADARTISVVATATTPDASVPPPALRVIFWIADDDGALAPLPAAPSAGSAPGTVSATLPTTGGPWRLRAVDVQLDPGDTASTAQVRLTGLTSGATVATPGWRPEPQAFRDSGTGTQATALDDGGLGFDAPLVAAGRESVVRLLPKAADELPVLVTRAAAEASGLGSGSRIDIDAPWGSVTGTVAGVVDAVPGTADQNAVLIDLPALDDRLLSTSPTIPRLGSVWLAAPDPQRVARAAAQAAGPDAVVTDASGAFVARFLGSAVAALWLGAAGCALLAVVALAATALSALRSRRGEVVVLRAVGVGSRQQAAARRWELGGVVAGAAIVGVLGGLAVVLLAGNALARLSVVTAPSTLSVQGRIDAALPAALGALALAVGVVLWLYGRAVRAQVLDTAHREETR
ncbi:hypothetical protein IT072_13245 [Leifsonia sp. ZF2019]|uniref:hypothetical protein n=1 Tax=Leifsonia sp. ZF2019 TaxID=2781978 RepID=UPI001CBA8362|nr:hypothetical protein [Leifsonia sp. ZF2019]UAJ78232.1 hypothetical protein IT072_13245 [Leifsonia sp. ZF2019]